MPIRLQKKANERSTYPIQLEFRDGGEAGPLVAPSSAAWSLVDDDGAVVNGREDVALSAPGGYGLIVLSGADLAVPGQGEVTRHLTVSAVYTSATYGAGLSLTEEFVISVQPLRGIPAGG